MRFSYAYKTRDGVRHEASIEAESRDAAFAALRQDGIRPIKVVAADGSKANGAQSAPLAGGKVERWNGWKSAAVVLLVLFVLFVLSILLSPRLRTSLFSALKIAPASSLASLDTTRRFPIGDAAIIEKGILTGWSDVFQNEGERFLASFAVPGVKAGQRSTTAGELEAALARRIAIPDDAGLEARQIMAMVEGMKQEARAYVAAGGNVVEYGKRLTERQDAEIAFYERTKAEMEQAKKTRSGHDLIEFWEEKNDALRHLGIRPITLESLE